MDNASVSAEERLPQTNLLTNRFTHITVRLNRHYLLNYVYNYSYDRIVNTAEHELGHAIGLDHTDGESVMQLAPFYSIQDTDVKQSDNCTRKNKDLKYIEKFWAPGLRIFAGLVFPLFNP